MIVVWDDHEFTNNTWKNGAENHSLDEGIFYERKINALKAYYEWMPIRENKNKRIKSVLRKDANQKKANNRNAVDFRKMWIL